MIEQMFHFAIRGDLIIIRDINGILYCSKVSRIFKELNKNSFEMFIYEEIMEVNENISINKFEFCKCFLNFAKEINR